MAATNVVKHDKYDTAKLDALYQIVKNAQVGGTAQDYEILVDGLRVVPRTSNPESFNNFSDFIQEDSKTVLIKMYRGGSNLQDKFFFHITDVPSKGESLNGFVNNTKGESEIEQKERLLKEIRYDQLEKENKELKSKLEECERDNDKLHDDLEQLKQGKLLSIGEMGSSIIMGLVKHPKVQENFPALSGFAEGSTKEQTANEVKPEEEASFKRKGEPEKKDDVVETVSEEEKGYMLLIRDLEERLNPNQLASAMHILRLLTENPSAIGSTMKHLNNFLSVPPENRKA